MGIHITAGKGEVASVVLLPGDPLRAQYIAERFLEKPSCYNRTRNMLGFTGVWRGRRVSVQGTGMGAPSLGIYAHELICDHGATTLLRVGTCGAVQDRIGLRQVLLVSAASTDSGMNRKRFRGMDFAPAADFELLRAAHDAAGQTGTCCAVGTVLSTDAFYDEEPSGWQLWARFGVLAMEMETAELYTVAARHGVRALSLLTVSDHIPRGQSLSPEERERAFPEMVELALRAAFPDAPGSGVV